MDTVLEVIHLLCHQKSVCDGSGMGVSMSICSSKQEMEQAGSVTGNFEEAGDTLTHERMLKRSYCCGYQYGVFFSWKQKITCAQKNL